MNKIKLSFALAAVIALPATIHAQPTNPPPSGLTDFGNTVLGYFTSFNPGLDSTFGNSRFDLWIGASSIQGAGQNLQNDIGFSYDIWRPVPATNVVVQTALSLENVVRNSGVVGTLQSENFGLGFSIIVHDVKLTLYGDAGYDLWNKSAASSERFYGEIGMRVKKAIGTHFYTGVGMGAQFPKNAQVFSAFAGATF